ncbi:M48 family metalloprotease [Streptomyces kanamyceticus]|uniref:M48 family metalloprotease n=1 Tax=Streptomyces kanamyceticus TaxID=1967 RepID=UPI0037DDC09E
MTQNRWTRGLTAGLVLVLLALLYLLAAVIVVGSIAVLAVSAVLLISMSPLFVIGKAAVLPVVKTVFGALRGSVERTEPGARRVSGLDAPELWRFVEELARRAGTPAPTLLWLTAGANAKVRLTGWTRRRRRRCLYVGVPLLLALDADELRAVLAHELGHYARHDSWFSALVYRGAAKLRDIDGGLSRSALPMTDVRLANALLKGYACVLRGFFGGFAYLYAGVTSPVLRRQEYAADDFAAQVVSPAVVARALRSAEAVHQDWSMFRGGVLTLLHHRDRMPDDPFRAFLTARRDPELRALVEVHAPPPPRDRRRPDTHPTMPARLKALEAAGTRGPGEDAVGAWAEDLGLEAVLAKALPAEVGARMFGCDCAPDVLSADDWLAEVERMVAVRAEEWLRHLYDLYWREVTYRVPERPTLRGMRALLDAEAGTERAARLRTVERGSGLTHAQWEGLIDLAVARELAGAGDLDRRLAPLPAPHRCVATTVRTPAMRNLRLKRAMVVSVVLMVAASARDHGSRSDPAPAYRPPRPLVTDYGGYEPPDYDLPDYDYTPPAAIPLPSRIPPLEVTHP